MRELTQLDTLTVSGAGFFLAPFLWGSLVGAVSYMVRHKDKEVDPQGFAMSTIGGGVSGSFGVLGVAGKGISLLNTVNAIEAVNHLENQQE